MSGAAQPITLAIYPTSRGYGWAAFESPLSPHDSGIVEVRKDKNARCLATIGELFDRLTPETLVLEAFERLNSARTDRIARLCRAMSALAASRGIDCLVYSRRDVEMAFGPSGARTRHEIAAAVARHLPALAVLPEKRKQWKAEHRRMSLFNAAALVLTHYRHQALFFLDHLNDAA